MLRWGTHWVRQWRGTWPSLGGAQGRLPGKGESWAEDTAQRVLVADTAGLGWGPGSPRDVQSRLQSCRTGGSSFTGFRVIGSIFFYFTFNMLSRLSFPQDLRCVLLGKLWQRYNVTCAYCTNWKSKSSGWVGGQGREGVSSNPC